ncbi:MAG: undecaprenyldiphospho-muramoylpentapeptide beta-N-acetylglucosaminyltransferase [Bacteroidales bacterium]|nr:undecaprenyldiphospho-muramoylpentapeptide beta-N-acetylglucosaminyltransferase [Bacteroidales bacterium]
MSAEVNDIRIIISGGGTGGHLFPAIAIANALRRIEPAVKILFVGAIGKMEMQKVPEAGYEIEGLPVAGLVRGFSVKNITVLWKLFRSMLRSAQIIRRFSPDVVVGVGGYASGPVLKQAQRKHIPTIIQEQNSYAGVTNKLLARKAEKICVAYEGMEKYFPKEKIIMTGNPVRQAYDNLDMLRAEAVEHFRLKSGMPVILVLGGSLGAGTVNSSVGGGIGLVEASGVQMIWQTGSHYYDRMRELAEEKAVTNTVVTGFINRMDLAYAAADVIISRAGAGTISELALVGKPVILVPSPNVAEDHQTHNAMALVNRGAAILVRDAEAQAELINTALALVHDGEKRNQLSDNIRRLAIKNSDEVISREVLKLVKR